MPKISIIVPCWGVEKYLDKCVESLVNQTFRDIEIILVDDLSPDRVPEMCDAWAQRDSRIRVIHKPKNEGLGLACNTGLEAATGKYVAFCDSDDWVDAEMYETMYIQAEENEADAVITGLKDVDQYGTFLGYGCHDMGKLICTNRQQINSLSLDMIASVPHRRKDRYIEPSAKTILYRKELIDKFNLRFQSERVIPSEDIFFNLNYFSHSSKICVLPDMFYNYRITPGSISKTVSRNLFDEKYAVLYKHLLEACEKAQLGDDSKLRTARMLIGNVRIFVLRIVKSSLTLKEKKEVIANISKHPLWKDVWSSYPKKSMPIAHRIFAEAVDRRNYCILYAMSKMK